MPKQVVIETHYSVNHVNVSVSVPDVLPKILLGKREREEVTVSNKVIYWIRVPKVLNKPSVEEKSKIQQEALCTRLWKEEKGKHSKLVNEKRKRLEKYAIMIANGEEVWGNQNDLKSCVNLMEFENKKKKSIDQIFDRYSNVSKVV